LFSPPKTVSGHTLLTPELRGLPPRSHRHDTGRHSQGETENGTNKPQKSYDGIFIPFSGENVNPLARFDAISAGWRLGW